MALLPFYLRSHTQKGKFMSLLIGFSIAFRQQKHRICARFTFRVLFPDCLLNNKLITFLTRTKIKLKLVLFLLFSHTFAQVFRFIICLPRLTVALC